VKSGRQKHDRYSSAASYKRFSNRSEVDAARMTSSRKNLRMPIRSDQGPHSCALLRTRLTARCASWSGERGLSAASPGRRGGGHSIFKTIPVIPIELTITTSSPSRSQARMCNQPPGQISTAAPTFFPWPDEKQSAWLAYICSSGDSARLRLSSADRSRFARDDPGHTSTTGERPHGIVARRWKVDRQRRRRRNSFHVSPKSSDPFSMQSVMR